MGSLKDFFSGKRVVVTGGSGFVGSNLIRVLVESDARVRASVHKSAPQIEDDRVEFVNCDLRRLEDCKALTDTTDYVIMAAAISSGAGVIANSPLVHLPDNIVMNTNMLNASHSNRVKRFCFISSSVVYPDTCDRVKEDDAAFTFFDGYYVSGWMKRFSEVMCDMYSRLGDNNMNTIVVRPSNLYGPYDKFDKGKSKVIPALIQRAVDGENPLMVWGDGTDIKDFLYVEDFVEGLLTVIAMVDTDLTVNIASEKSVTIGEVALEILKTVSPLSREIQFQKDMPVMIKERRIDSSLMRSLTGWQPVISMQDGIKKTVSWYQTNHRSV